KKEKRKAANRSGQPAFPAVQPGIFLLLDNHEQQSGCQDNAQGIFPVAEKKPRCRKVDENSAKGSTDRDAEVETRQALRVRTEAKRLAVANDAGGEQQNYRSRNLRQVGEARIDRNAEQHTDNGQGEQRVKKVSLVPGRALKG